MTLLLLFIFRPAVLCTFRKVFCIYILGESCLIEEFYLFIYIYIYTQLYLL